MTSMRGRSVAGAAAIVAGVHVSIVAFAAPMTKQACLQAVDEGQDLRAASKLKGARAKLLTCAVDACPAVIRSDCARWVSELDESIPSVVVRVTRAGSDVVGAKVTIDGEEVDVSQGKPTMLDPGKHALVVAVDGGKPIEQTLVVVTGERNRVVTVEAPSDSVVAPPPQPIAKPPEKPAQNEHENAHAPAWAWVSGAVGVVALGGFVFFAVSGKHDISHLESTCAPYCTDDVVDAAHRKLVYGDVSLAVSIVALGVATYGFLSVPTSSASTANVGVVPGGGVITWRGAF